MKVFALAILLVSVCCMEGTVVRRQAEQAPAQDAVQEIQNYFTTLSEYVRKEIVPQEKIEEIRAQAIAYAQQAQQHVTPVAEQLREQAAQFFSSLLDTFKKQVK